MNTISRLSKVPLYYQLYQILLDQIRSGVLQPEDMLPSEAELVEEFNLSRSTVRQALDMLVNDGLIHRRRGQGTFVATPTIEQNLSRIISFWEDMRQRGLRPATKVLSSELVAAPEDIAAALQIKAGEELANIVRLRLADDEPMSVEHSFLVHNYCPGVTRKYHADLSLRQMLADQYNVTLVYAKQKNQSHLCVPFIGSGIMHRAKRSIIVYRTRLLFRPQHSHRVSSHLPARGSVHVLH